MYEDIIVITKPVSLTMIKKTSKQGFGDFVKAVVDIQQNIMAINGELHADEEGILLKHGSDQKNLWGINLYPYEFDKENWIEFDSLINIRPSMNNRSRGVEDIDIQRKIQEIVHLLIKKK
ncbi:MAG: DUF5674 family protein [Candidatus Absconditabacterales bacterium]